MGRLKGKCVIIYDGDCSLCLSTRRLLQPLDLFRTLSWVPLQAPEAVRFGIPREALETHLHFVSSGRHWRGFAAVKQVLLRLPLFYLATGLAVVRFPRTAIGVALFFSPFFSPIGEHLYDRVASSRHGAACALR